jgi:hypothetical protein
MVIPKPPKKSLVDTIQYEEITGKNDYNVAQYAAPMTISDVRIDRTTKYNYTSGGRTILYNAVIFCYAGLSTPMLDFLEESRVTFDGQEHIIINVLKNHEPYSDAIYSIELEVV